MPSERTYYVICGDNCKFESMTKEQIFAAITDATGNTPTDVDDAFITQIKEMRANSAMKFWIGTQAQYNALAMVDYNTLYLITDDTSAADINSALENMNTQIEALGDGKVDKVAGKGLSTNDYSTEEKTKLDGITTNATRTVPYYQIEIAPIDTTTIILPELNGTTLDRISIYPAAGMSLYSAIFLEKTGELSMTAGVKKATYIGYYLSALGGSTYTGSISGELDIMTGETIGTLTLNSATLMGSEYSVVGTQTY